MLLCVHCVYLCVQLKWGLAEHRGAPAEELVLIHSGRALKDAELLSHLKRQDGLVSLCMIQRYTNIWALVGDQTCRHTYSTREFVLHPYLQHCSTIVQHMQHVDIKQGCELYGLASFLTRSHRTVQLVLH